MHDICLQTINHITDEAEEVLNCKRQGQRESEIQAERGGGR